MQTTERRIQAATGAEKELYTTMSRAIFVLAAALLLLGCVTYPQGTGSGAGYVGDRESVGLDEVVVSVPAGDSSYRNLHIELSAIINPRQVSVYDPNEVRSLVTRLQARIEARLVEVIVELGEIGAGDLASVRDRVAREAQSVLDAALATWKHSSAYQVEVAVVSLYFTDGSVEVQKESRPRWW